MTSSWEVLLPLCRLEYGKLRMCNCGYRWGAAEHDGVRRAENGPQRPLADIPALGMEYCLADIDAHSMHARLSSKPQCMLSSV